MLSEYPAARVKRPHGPLPDSPMPRLRQIDPPSRLRRGFHLRLKASVDQSAGKQGEIVYFFTNLRKFSVLVKPP
jgi:hypothetical protein